MSTLDLETLRGQFPALAQQVNGKPLVYLDNAATTQKPLAVLAALDGYYRGDCANIHRGVHTLSARAGERYEAVRETIQARLGAQSAQGVVFTAGTTASINLVAACLERRGLAPGDEILVSGLEHHSNLVPWLMLCERTGAKLRVAMADADGVVSDRSFQEALSSRTRLAAFTHVSNALGTVNPVAEWTRWAHEAGAQVLVDGAQAVAHLPVDLAAIGCEFYALSAHKVYGPTGCGALVGTLGALEALPPWQGGGDMIAEVDWERVEYNELPWRLEAGTPHVAGVIGMGAAFEFLAALPGEALAAHEDALLEAACALLDGMPRVRRLGRAPWRAGVVSFVVEGAHASDVATLLDMEGVAVRSGHHCAQPLLKGMGVPATVRASFGCYNTLDEVERFGQALAKALRLLGLG